MSAAEIMNSFFSEVLEHNATEFNWPNLLPIATITAHKVVTVECLEYSCRRACSRREDAWWWHPCHTKVKEDEFWGA